MSKAQVTTLKSKTGEILYPITKIDQVLYKKLDNTYGQVLDLLSKRLYIDEEIPESAPNGSIGFNMGSKVTPLNIDKILHPIITDGIKAAISPNMKYCIIYSTNGGCSLYHIKEDGTESLSFKYSITAYLPVLACVFNMDSSKFIIVKKHVKYHEVNIYSINKITQKIELTYSTIIGDITSTILGVAFDKYDNVLIFNKSANYDTSILAYNDSKYSVYDNINIGYNEKLFVDSYNKLSVLYSTDKILTISPDIDFTTYDFLSMDGKLFTIPLSAIQHPSKTDVTSISRSIVGYQLISDSVIYITKNVNGTDIWFSLCKNTTPVSTEVIIDNNVLPSNYSGYAPLSISRDKKSLLCSNQLKIWDILSSNKKIKYLSDVSDKLTVDSLSYTPISFISNRYMLSLNDGKIYLYDLSQTSYEMGIKFGNKIYKNTTHSHYFKLDDVKLNGELIRRQLYDSSVKISLQRPSGLEYSNYIHAFNPNYLTEPLEFEISQENMFNYVSHLRCNTSVGNYVCSSVDEANNRIAVLQKNILTSGSTITVFDIKTGKMIFNHINSEIFTSMEYVLNGTFIICKTGTKIYVFSADLLISLYFEDKNYFIVSRERDELFHYNESSSTAVEAFELVKGNDSLPPSGSSVYGRIYKDIVKININGNEMLAFHNGVDNAIYIIDVSNSSSIYYTITLSTDMGLNTRPHTLFSNNKNIIGISGTNTLSFFELKMVNGVMTHELTNTTDMTTSLYYIKSMLPTGRLITEYKSPSNKDITTESLFYYVNKSLVTIPCNYNTFSKVINNMVDESFYKNATLEVLSEKYSIIITPSDYIIVKNSQINSSIYQNNEGMIIQNGYIKARERSNVLAGEWKDDEYGRYIDIDTFESEINQYSTIKIIPLSVEANSMLKSFGIDAELRFINSTTCRAYASSKAVTGGNFTNLLYDIIILN